MRLSAWILTVIVLLPGWPAAAGELVGAAGWVDRIEFIGNTAFTTDELRDGLSADLDYLAATQPHAPRSEFLTALADRLREGYRHRGFLDAEIVAEESENGQRTTVRITEGPQYRCGHVMVRGGRTVRREEIEQAFTEPWAETGLFPVTTLTARGVQVRWETEHGTKGNLAAPLWVPGVPLPGADFDLAQYHSRVKEALGLQGYFAPKLRMSLHRAPQAQSATLVIDIDEQGPPSVFGGLSVRGETQDTVEDVMRFLELRRGERLNFRSFPELGRRLWNSGRYYNISWTTQAVGLPGTPTTADASKEADGSNKKVDSQRNSVSDFSLATKGDPGSKGAGNAGDRLGIDPAHPVPPDLDPDRPVSALIHLELTNVGNLPPLREELTPADRAMLRFCVWLRNWPDNSEDDLVAVGKVQSWGLIDREIFRIGEKRFSASVPSRDFHWRFRTVFSSGGRLFVRLRHAFNQDEPGFDQAAIVQPDGIDWRFPLRKSRLSVPWGARQVLACTLRLPLGPPGAAAGDSTPTHFDYRFNSRRAAHSAPPATPGLYPGFLIDPPLVLLYLRSEGVTHSLTEGVLRVTSPRLQLEIDADSGRLIRAHTVGWNGTATIDLWTERRALAKAAEELDDETGPLAERFDPGDPWDSICECLRWEFSPLGELPAPPAWPTAAAALRVLRPLGPRQLVEILELLEGAERPFSIPSPDEPVPGSIIVPQRGGDVAATLLPYVSRSDDLRALVVDAILQRARGKTYIPHEIPAIARRTSTGPLTRLVALGLMTDNQSELRKLVAARAVEHLTAAGALENLRALAAAGVPIGTELERLFEALGELSEEECRTLAGWLLPENLARAVVNATAPLRQDRVRPVRELLPEVFARMWSGGLETEIADLLKDWAIPAGSATASESTDDPDNAFPVVPINFNQSAPSEDVSFPEGLPELPGAEHETPEAKPGPELMLEEGD